MHVHRRRGVVGHEPDGGDVVLPAHLRELVGGRGEPVDRAREAAREPVEHPEAGEVLRPEVVTLVAEGVAQRLGQVAGAVELGP